MICENLLWSTYEDINAEITPKIQKSEQLAQDIEKKKTKAIGGLWKN